MQARYWKVHLDHDRYDHWITVDCGVPVDETMAVRLTDRAYYQSDRGRVTNAVPVTSARYEETAYSADVRS